MPMMRFRIAQMLVAVCLSVFPSIGLSAATLEDARQAYFDGRFENAAETAENDSRTAGSPQDQAEAHILAARSWLELGRNAEDPKVRSRAYAAGEAQADAALALDPDIAEAHLYKALALGFRSRQEGAVAAFFAGYPEQAKAHIDRALELDPKNAWAFASLGGWNLEIIRTGGEMGQTLLDASETAGTEAYQRALAIAPDNPMIAEQFALQLLALNPAEYAPAVAQVLSFFPTEEPLDERSATERAAFENIAQLQTVVANGDTQAMRAYALSSLGDRMASPGNDQSARPEIGGRRNAKR